jgi:hypothetical protein
MTFSRILMFTAALAVAVALPALAQGRGAAQRPAKVTAAKGPKTANPNKPASPGRSANAGKPDRPGRSADAGRRDAQGTSGSNRSDRADATFVDRINANPEQKARLEAMLPSGMTLAQAADGFRNQGQFIAALQASKNQNIPFASLKTEMTGPNQLSLGQAIEKLKPSTSTSTTTTTTGSTSQP